MSHFDDEMQQYDSEFCKFFDAFAFHEVLDSVELEDKTKYMAVLATLLGCQGIEEYKYILPIALEHGVEPVEVKEIVYQATAYLGIGRTRPFFAVTNQIYKEKGIALPLAPQGTTTPENRREKGTAKQVELFGPQMEDFWKKGNINRWLAGNCFGDYYTRKGLDNGQREMITFCYIAAQGGCEPQLMSHTVANFANGNDKEFMLKVVSCMVPFIGYPRSLNAIAVINQAAEKNN